MRAENNLKNPNLRHLKTGLYSYCTSNSFRCKHRNSPGGSAAENTQLVISNFFETRASALPMVMPPSPRPRYRTRWPFHCKPTTGRNNYGARVIKKISPAIITSVNINNEQRKNKTRTLSETNDTHPYTHGLKGRLHGVRIHALAAFALWSASSSPSRPLSVRFELHTKQPAAGQCSLNL